MSLESWQYPLYVPPSHLEDIKVRYRIMNLKTTKVMEQPTKTLVIFGATGDLCRRKLIPALESLHKRNLLPLNFKIIGASRTDHDRQSWLESLNRYYEADFSLKLDYHQCDLSDVDSLRSIPQSDDMTYFLSVPPERYGDAIQNLKAAGLVDDRDKSRVVIEKPFGTDLESADHLQSVVERSLREKQDVKVGHNTTKVPEQSETCSKIICFRS